MDTKTSLKTLRPPLGPALLALGLFTMSACGPSNNGTSPPPPVSATDMGSTDDMDDGTNPGDDMDMSENPSGDMTDMEGDMTDTPTDMDPDQGGGTVTDGLCNNVEDLGVLDTSSNVVLMGNTSNVIDEFATSCGFGSAAETGWRFTVDSPVGVYSNITAAGIAWVLELHEGTCDSPTRRFCDPSLDTNFFLEPGKEYILIAEPRQNQRGSLTVNLEFTPLVCLPVGSTTCEGNTLEICAQGGASTIEETCALPCAMDACGGDVCENAISVDSLPYMHTGSMEGYFDRFNLNTDNTCLNPNNAGTPGGGDDPDDPEPDPVDPGDLTGRIQTPGQDMAFMVKGLSQGDKLFVDASEAVGDTADNVIYIMDSCDYMSCHVAIDLGDKIDGWEVPADGDYLVVVDRTTDQNNDFAVSIWTE